MKILNIIQCTNLGGMERASLLLMSGLQRRGHEVKFLSMNKPGEIVPILKDEGFEVSALDYERQSKTSFMKEIRKTIRVYEPDAVIMTGHNIYAALAMLPMRGLPKIISLHFHHEGVMPRWQWFVIYIISILTFDRIHFVSDFIRAEAEKILPFVARKAFTLGNPFKLRERLAGSARREFREKFGLPSTAPVVGNAGWLIERKRFDVFIETASELLKRIPDAHFVIAGDGEQRQALVHLVEARGLSARVVWTGWLDDTDPFFEAIDVLLFVSDFDALGRTPLEAIAAGVPAVVSVVKGGLGEVLDNSVSWFFQEHDPSKLADAVADALTTTGKKKVGRARDRLASVADPQRLAERFEAEINAAIST